MRRIFGPAAAFALAFSTLPIDLVAQDGASQPVIDHLAEADARRLPEVPDEWAAVRAGLAKYENFAQAEGEAYMAVGCTDYSRVDPSLKRPAIGLGGEMEQISYPLLIDPELDLGRPEGLVYEKGEAGKLKIAAAIWMVWPKPDMERPTLFGQPFEGPVKLEKDTPLQHVKLQAYELYVWLWKENPAGLFARQNPDLPCYSDGYAIMAEPL